MKKIVLIGAGQHCNVVIYNLLAQNKYEIACILDPDKSKWGTFNSFGNVFIENDYEDYNSKYLDYIKNKYNTEYFFIGLGSMKLRKKIYNFFISNGWQSVNIIHPNSVVSNYSNLGKGILIEAGCLITPSPRIGNNVVINTGSQVNHDNFIADHVYIASGVILSGGVIINENTLIDDGVIITLGKQIGENSLIGAGSVVTKDIPKNSVAYGNPCKVIRNNIF